MIWPLQILPTLPVVMHFWASPHNTIITLADWGAIRRERNTFSLIPPVPEIVRDESPEAPSPRPLPEFPTDVPAPEPHDVPVPEPVDPPVPKPEKVPPPTKPKPNPKPRSVP